MVTTTPPFIPWLQFATETGAGPPPPAADYLLQEDGFYILQEDGSRLELA